VPSHTHLPAPRLRPTALACTSLILGVMLSGCGGGSSGDAVTQTDSGYQVASGVAQKGPLARGSWISINELNPNTLAPVGTSFNFEIRDDLGTFQPDSTVFTRPLLESTAMGYYFDELTGKVSTDVVILRGMSDLAVDRAVNINLLTDLANARTRALMTRTTSPLKFAAARAQAQREVLQALFLFNSSDLLPGGATEPASFGELDLSKNRINQFINQFEADLLDDGLINNSPKFASSLATKLNTAFKTVDFAKLAANLNTFYGTTRYTAASLSQWVDTSGGVDKVIDRYKSTAANIPVGTESKSVEYVAGTNDAGQCISSSTGKLYRNGVEVTTGTVKAVKGDKYVLGLTATTASTVNGFIQRTATSAGLCPATKPTAGITRLNKNSVDFIEPTSSTIIDTASTTGLIHIENEYGPMEDIHGQTNYILKSDGVIYTWNTAEPGKIAKILISKSIKNILTENGAINYLMDGNIVQPQIFTSRTNTHRIKSDGSIWSMGENTRGQLGDGTTAYSPIEKNIGAGYKKILPITRDYGSEPAVYSLLGLKSDGSLWAWGANEIGQLGDGTKTDILSPKKIGDGFSRIEVFYTSITASKLPQYIGMKSDGSLWAWGYATKPPLSQQITLQITPKKIGDNFSSFKYLGPETFIAGKSDGTAWAWGENANYFTGKVAETPLTPTQIPDIISINHEGETIIGTKKMVLHGDGNPCHSQNYPTEPMSP